jgi:hypothetical protein
VKGIDMTMRMMMINQEGITVIPAGRYAAIEEGILREILSSLRTEDTQQSVRPPLDEQDQDPPR